MKYLSVLILVLFLFTTTYALETSNNNISGVSSNSREDTQREFDYIIKSGFTVSDTDEKYFAIYKNAQAVRDALVPSSIRIIIVTSSDGGSFRRVNTSIYSDLGQNKASGMLIEAKAGALKFERADFEDVLVKWFVLENETNNLASVQRAVNSSATSISVSTGSYNLEGGTLTIPKNKIIKLDGGVLTNGTIKSNETKFYGVRGLSETIKLEGTIAGDEGVLFDWFVNEKTLLADYLTFINPGQPTYGAIPKISATNRTIYRMLLDLEYPVKFGMGVYPFDAELSIKHDFKINGAGKAVTLLWAPNSNFFNFEEAKGSFYPYINDITIEADGNIIRTTGWITNAIHELVIENSHFISYNNHAFYNDKTTAGGTGTPIYGTKVTNSAVGAGDGFSGFAGWQSASNVFDAVHNNFQYFAGGNPAKLAEKGTMLALFYNSNVLSYTNSNISYGALEYVYVVDVAGLYSFYAYHNIFEKTPVSFQAIVKTSNVSNFRLRTRGNQYIDRNEPDATARETGYHYILNGGNIYVDESDSPTPLFGSNIRNRSNEFLRVVTNNIDSGGTKFRLEYHEPKSVNADGTSTTNRLYGKSTELADLFGMRDIYDANIADISYFSVKPSATLQMAGEFANGQGTTAQRPTTMLYLGRRYYDTTLGIPIFWNGTEWISMVDGIKSSKIGYQEIILVLLFFCSVWLFIKINSRK